MKIFMDGVTPGSRSGPNSFSRKLSEAVRELGHDVVFPTDQTMGSDVRLLFIQGAHSSLPTALRLDGIYFNTRQSWEEMNEPIRRCYDRADLIIHQTEFDRTLIERFFGKHSRAAVVRNGADTRKTMDTAPLVHPALDSFEQTWVCASSWRPHKRLVENIRYFQEHASSRSCLVVAGDISQVADGLRGMSLERVFFAGDLDQQTLTALYRRASHLVHLAWLDHCPNVVVDARAAGCKIICSSSGGTEEIAGESALVIQEDEWDFSPVDLYNPPKLDFSRARRGTHDFDLDIMAVAGTYLRELSEIVR